MNQAEGVVKYSSEHVEASAEAGRYGFFDTLNAWRDRLHALGLIGVDPRRYGGFGFGNLSHRLPGGCFLITATQTGQLRTLGPQHYVKVRTWDIRANQLASTGLARPSSEALTHAAVYEAVASCQCVMHVHSPAIWRQAAELGLLRTPAEAEYGTPAMAMSIRQLAKQGLKAGVQAISMTGHEDGVIAFGSDPDQTGAILLGLLS